ncbi:MAG: hypothetical protein IKM55_01830 [Bacilli bacterium]|nr:hypothetical protein [Bacilli bacterium]
MNDTLINELKETINQIKEEIKEKRKVLDELIEQYQEISGIELDEEIERI